MSLDHAARLLLDLAEEQGHGQEMCNLLVEHTTVIRELRAVLATQLHSGTGRLLHEPLSGAALRALMLSGIGL